MRSVFKFGLALCVGAGIGAAGFAAMAQKDPKVGTTVNDPIGPAPDPAKPGPYMVKYIWWPGNFSKPHYHNNERFAYVVSGTWWTSTSKVYDERTTYPVHAGSVAVDKRRGIHWDGARTGEKEPAVLILAGTGPNITQPVDENGKDMGPPR